VQGLWECWGLLAIELPAYAHFLLSGSYALVVSFFRHAGGAFFILMGSAETYCASPGWTLSQIPKSEHRRLTM
jgi:hypothetical protein